MARVPNSPPPRGEIVCVAIESERNDAAATVAADLSRHLGRPLVLVDVQVPVPPAPTAHPPMAPTPPLPAEVPEPPRPAPRDLDGLAARAGGGPVRYETRIGDPAAVLRALADEPATALLVAPDDGSGAFATALGANPARRALRDVTCPVVLVPQDCAGLSDPLTIIAAVASDGAIDDVVGVAAALVAELHGRLVLVHGWTEPHDDEALERARAALPPDIGVEIRTGSGEAGAAIESVATEVGAGLIVLGPPAHGPLLSALLGSTTHEVASRAHTPVLVVPVDRA